MIQRFFDGSAVFSNLQAQCFPNGSMGLMFTATLNGKVVSVSQCVSFRRCIAGEIYEATTGACTKCPLGEFQLKTNGDNSITECKRCTDLESADVCFENVINLKPGFWRVSNNTIAMYPCPFGETACMGGLSHGDELCAEGYEGKLVSFLP